MDEVEIKVEPPELPAGSGDPDPESKPPPPEIIIKAEPEKSDDVNRREHLLVVRLAAKEQELQELSNQIAELKAAQSPSTAAMRSALLDPAVNVMMVALKKELESTKAKLAQTTEEMSAWKFTPDSVTGKRLMAKCRQLLQVSLSIYTSMVSVYLYIYFYGLSMYI